MNTEDATWTLATLCDTKQLFEDHFDPLPPNLGLIKSNIQIAFQWFQMQVHISNEPAAQALMKSMYANLNAVAPDIDNIVVAWNNQIHPIQALMPRVSKEAILRNL